MANKLELTPADIEDYFEQPLPANLDWVQKIIDRAVRALYALCQRIDERIASGELDPESVTDVVADAVLRVIRNPVGITNETEGNYGIGVNQMVASGDVWFPAKDIEQICGKSSGLPRSARLRPNKCWAVPR